MSIMSVGILLFLTSTRHHHSHPSARTAVALLTPRRLLAVGVLVLSSATNLSMSSVISYISLGFSSPNFCAVAG